MAGTGTTMPYVALQWFTNDGDPAASYKLFTYEAGTTTKLNTYTDVDLTVANANPVVLDASGRATVFLSPASYKFVLASPTDTDPPASPIWTRDNISATPPFNVDLDVIGTAGEALTTNDAVYLYAGDGGRTAGRWYKSDADNDYSSITASGLGMVPASIALAATGSIRITGRVTGLAGLSTGTVYYISATAGAITSSAPANARPIAVADSSTSVILSQWLPIIDASATQKGLVNITTQSFGGNKTFTGTLTSTGLATFTAGFVSNAESTSRAGATASTQVNIGGVFVADVTPVTVIAGQTDSVMTNSTIPANMLNANGKCIHIVLGSSVDDTGTNQHQVELDIGGTQIIVINHTSTDTSWYVDAWLVRTTSTTMQFHAVGFRSVATPDIMAAQEITGLDYTAAIALRSLGTTGATSTLTQSYFIGALLP